MNMMRIRIVGVILKSSLIIALIICLSISSVSVKAIDDKSVLFLTTGGRTDLGINSTSVSEGLTTFAQNLQNAGFTVEERAWISSEMLSKYRVLVIHDAAFYSPSYTPLIKDFVNNGGGLLIFSEGLNNYDFDELTLQFGVKINKDSVYENSNIIEISTFSDHPIFKGIKTLQGKFSSVTAKPPALEAAKGSLDSYISGENQRSAPPVIAVSQLGKGKVVVIGAHHIFRNYDIQVRDNLKFGVNCIDWLSTAAVASTATPPTTAKTVTPTATPTKPAPGFEAAASGIALIAVALLAIRKR